MDLAYIQTGIREVFFWVLNFENLYFLGYRSKSLYFLGYQINAVFLRLLCLQRYFWPNSIRQVLQQTQLFILLPSRN